nr:virginiamycin b lyase [Quercus suber]
MLTAVALLAAPLLALASPIVDRAAGTFTFYDMKTLLAGPCDLAEGPDGALWGQDILVDKIFRVDPKSGNVDEYDIPFTTPFSNQTLPDLLPIIANRTALACAIRSGADGNLYAGNGLRNQLVRINPTTKKIDVFEPPPSNPAGTLFPFNDIYTSETGLYYTQTTGNSFNFFEYASESFTETFDVPTALSIPLGIFVASDKLVYICELIGNKILIFDPSNKEMKEYPLPAPLQGPAVVRAEHDGYVYFSLFTGNGIGRINMKTHDIDLFPTSQLLGLGSVVTGDNDGGVWLSFFTSNVIARLDTKTLTYTYVPFPDTFASSLGLSGILGDLLPYADISVNYGPGDAIWFGSLTRNQVGRYSLS